MAAPIACAECHPIPGDTAHATNPPPARVTFGTLASANGATPAWNQATGGCSASYCHGSFSFNGVSGTAASITWTDVTHLDCTSCHGMPPTGHIPVANAPAASSCSSCHPTSISPDGSVNLGGGTHLDGKADVAALGCTSCHGDATRTPRQAGTDANLVSAPPAAPTGAPAYAVGVHDGHVNPPATGAFSAPIACVVCHPPTTDLRHATSPPPSSVVFSGVALAGGARPTWTVSSTGCAATYCHGSFSYNGVSGSAATVSWTDTAPLTCTSCHGMPPTGHVAVNGAPAASSCAACHPNAVNPDGTINLAAGGHLNGRPDTSAVGCTACHGDAGRTGNLPGTDVNLISSPPVAPASAPAYATGAHLGHVNPTAGTALMQPIACGACHAVPGDLTHVGPAVDAPATLTWGTLATTGGASPSFDRQTATCSSTYCHGNFTGGSRAAPSWTGGTLACTACHATAPQTGRHQLHMSRSSINCLMCHNGIATGTGNPSTNATLVNAALHMNATKNVVFGGTFLGRPVTGTWNGTSCSGLATSCHGSEDW
jgi:predicted CxxxxCH...CXXCH cytochrome family protein